MTLVQHRRRPSEPAPLRALLVDDHQLLAQSVALALGVEGVDCTVAPLGEVSDLLDLVARERPALVLLDLELGGALGDGSRLVEPLVGLGTRVVVLTATTDPEVLARTLEGGAAGVVSKALPLTELVAAVLAAGRGHDLVTPDRRRELIETGRRQRTEAAARRAPLERLTVREAQVLRSLGDGLAVSTIARGWRVSEATVRSQVRAVLTKLGVTSQLEAVAVARRAGWL